MKKIKAENSQERIDRIKKEIKPFFDTAKGSHDWEHTERVYNLCLKLGKKSRVDLEVLKLAAILHDIGREDQDKSKGKICHAERGAFLARPILEKYDLAEDKINKIVHCIETHRFRNNKIPQTKEAKILFDADKLDSIGATGIGRAFLFAGEVGAKLHNKQVDLSQAGAYGPEDTAYREFMVKLSKVRKRMFTLEGKKIARSRHKFMVEFFKRLNKEVEGKL
jgi:uncharacterized protein